MTLPDELQPVPNLTGNRESGGTFLGHFIDVFEFEERWQWSATHPAHCKSMGTGGIAETEKAALSRAQRAINGFSCTWQRR